MQRAIHRRVAGFTVVEMMVVILIIVLVVSLLMLGIHGARQAARRAECLSNIRQLGFGLKNYDQTYRVLPSVHTNVWALIADQLDYPIKVASSAHFANNTNDEIPDLYHCRTDEFRPATQQGCSYAPNCQEAPATSATGPGGPDEGNWQYSPWSNFKLDGSQNPVPSPNRLLSARGTTGAASNTIILVECWHHSNDIDVTGYQNTPFAPLAAYDGFATDPTMDNAGDAGAYRMFEDYGQKAADVGRTCRVKRYTYHGGQMSVLFADQHGESVETAHVALKRPKDNPLWTRQDD